MSDLPTIKEAEKGMNESVEAVRRDFSTVRTGKASPSLLDTVRVDAYGSKLPLNQVATVSAPEPSLLVVQPFDKSIVPEVEKAILQADLGLNPANDGQVIRVPVPALNEERRKEYVRLIGKMAEEGRVAIRIRRREANEEVKALMKEGELSDDDGHRALDQIQELTNKHIKQIDDLLAHKEKEIMSF